MLLRVVNGHAAVSADMDLRLCEALGTNQGYCNSLAALVLASSMARASSIIES